MIGNDVTVVALGVKGSRHWRIRRLWRGFRNHPELQSGARLSNLEADCYHVLVNLAP